MQEYSPKDFWFQLNHHDSAVKLFYVSLGYRISQRLGNEIDFNGLFVERDEIALSDLFAGLVEEWQDFWLFSVPPCLRGRFYPPAFAFFTSSVSAGTMSNRLPTTP